MGEDVSFESRMAVPNASKLLMSDKDGVIASQKNNNTPHENIVEVQFDYQVGDRVSKFKVGPHRIGHVISKGETLQEAVAILDGAIQNIEITID